MVYENVIWECACDMRINPMVFAFFMLCFPMYQNSSANSFIRTRLVVLALLGILRFFASGLNTSFAHNTIISYYSGNVLARTQVVSHKLMFFSCFSLPSSLRRRRENSQPFCAILIFSLYTLKLSSLVIQFWYDGYVCASLLAAD